MERIMPKDFNPELDAIVQRCVEMLWRDYAADAPTACMAGMGLIAYGLSLRMREEGTTAAEDLRVDVVDMIENDLDMISLVP
jgi:hypothetical protein